MSTITLRVNAVSHRQRYAGLTEAGRTVGGTEWIIVEQEDNPNGMGELEALAASLRGLKTILASTSHSPPTPGN